MSFKKRNLFVGGFIAVLFVACIAEGIVIYRHKSCGSVTLDRHDIESFSSKLEDRMQSHRNGNWKMFDYFFDDDFFSANHDAFKQMEKLRREMHDRMDDDMKNPFNDSWESWFGDRFFGNSEDMDMKTRDKGDAYVITLDIPHLKDDNLKISIDANCITINGSYAQTAEKKDDQGHVISRQNVQRTLSQSFPIPPDANYSKAVIHKDSGKIEIILPKLG